jgi:hypothetical protein
MALDASTDGTTKSAMCMQRYLGSDRPLIHIGEIQNRLEKRDEYALGVVNGHSASIIHSTSPGASDLE